MAVELRARYPEVAAQHAQRWMLGRDVFLNG
jgi:hypothetical protein